MTSIQYYWVHSKDSTSGTESLIERDRLKFIFINSKNKCITQEQRNTDIILSVTEGERHIYLLETPFILHEFE